MKIRQALEKKYTVEYLLKRYKAPLKPKELLPGYVNLIQKISSNENAFFDLKQNQLFIDEFDKNVEFDQIRKKKIAAIKAEIAFQDKKEYLLNDLSCIKQLTNSELSKVLEQTEVTLETVLNSTKTEN